MTGRTTSTGWTDEQFDIALAHALRGGVLLSAVVVTFGAVVFLARHGLQRPDYHAFRGEPAALRTMQGVISGTVRLSGSAIIQFGLLALIATPIAHVVLSVIGFWRERDWLYVATTLVVLSLLVFSLLKS